MSRPAWPATALVIGAGRAGTSLARAFAKAGIDTTLHARTKRQKIRGIRASFGVVPSLDPFTLVVLATPDGTIGELARALPQATRPHRQTVLHLAGALGLDVLEAAESKGFRVGSMHLLQSIATGNTTLKGCPTGLAAKTPATLKDLVGLARRLGLVPLKPNEARAAYHAAACVAGNYVQVLVEASLRLFAAAGIDREDALLAVQRLSGSALENAITKGPAAGLTGPIARGDTDTVRQHLAHMTDPKVRALYVAAGQLAVELAQARGTDTAAIERLLDATNRPT